MASKEEFNSKESLVSEATGDNIKIEAPLSTPNKSTEHNNNKPSDDISTTDPENKSSIVTIFDVATEIENMLQGISEEIDKNSELLLEKVNKITQKLDKIEGNVRNGA